ncbi:DNA-binding MarR family transcriptional regulator [Rhodococcus sp. 27YEA15]|uniref:MarR family transcriptional regulator n=1 Tax=Rhodococcus sp. 27YEA15 TaxID=3156259 RepID=UPI003C7AF18B
MPDATGELATASVERPEIGASVLRSLIVRGSRLEAAATAAGIDLGLSADEWLILDTLASADGLAMSTLSTHVLSAGASLTRAVDRLVSRSLVYRAPSLTDRRKVEVRISESGRREHAGLTAELAAIENVLRSALADAGIDPDAVVAALASVAAFDN